MQCVSIIYVLFLPQFVALKKIANSHCDMQIVKPNAKFPFLMLSHANCYANHRATVVTWAAVSECSLFNYYFFGIYIVDLYY